jgi:hypothetical protein
MRPGTVVRDIEMVASRLGLKSRRTVRRDPVSELAVGALKPPGGVGFGQQFLFRHWASTRMPIAYRFFRSLLRRTAQVKHRIRGARENHCHVTFVAAEGAICSNSSVTLCECIVVVL